MGVSVLQHFGTWLKGFASIQPQHHHPGPTLIGNIAGLTVGSSPQTRQIFQLMRRTGFIKTKTIVQANLWFKNMS